jgi:protein-L-isoaspartate(D-aspartate) O-methyltransferase
MTRSTFARHSAIALLLAGGACSRVEPAARLAPELDPFARSRAEMVAQQIRARGISDERVLAAMASVPRERFVPAELAASAYADRPLPIGAGQTISQPYVVAFMTEAARLRGGERVLEIGTGSGYQAAVLAEIAAEVYTIEIVPELGERARARLDELGTPNIRLRIGDGYRGWSEAAPFDAILVTAAPEVVPAPLLEQLAPGGRLIAPVGPSGDQQLLRLTRTNDGLKEERLLPVRFVPMTGEAEKRGE